MEITSYSVFFLTLSVFLVLPYVQASSGYSLTPNYDYQKMKFLDYKAVNILQCNVTGDLKPDHVLQWLKVDKPIESYGQNNRLEVIDSKLYIRRPLDEDITNYTCILVNKTSPNNPIAQAEFTTAAKPTAKLHAPVTVIEGEKLKLECIVTGKPVPQVQWRYEDKAIDRGHERIKLSDNREKGISGAFLEIENTQMSDRGEYYCSAHNIVTIVATNATEANTFVRVKDKLAALWPFIGICVEVIVLCTIIFVYERKRNRSELEESDTDQSPEQKNTPDHGKEAVRQRK